MNFGLVTSFIIAGILLLSILSLNMNLSYNSAELTMNQIVQQRINGIKEIIEHDIPKIAYNDTATVEDPITKATTDEIEFKSNIDNKDGDLETVRWKFDTNTPVDSPNPNDYVLRRSVDGTQTEIKLGVTDFELTYKDKNMNVIPLTNVQVLRNKIRHIELSVTVECPGKIGGADNISSKYVSTTWTHTFSPINLKF
ncbi:hypothetical protein [Fodinibius halophilus]|uniref:Uncharacterized protein n=1 Tax=Fodinibius halophilus TaxID=1736908 RepID=A0A6M1T9M8_9BACT|nr:hypothetical protein [Fodinibius halophilus]NGP90185.1 hypothetical protein [Fodinibius halophilus]